MKTQISLSLRCPHKGFFFCFFFRPWLSKMRLVKILIRLHKCTVWSKSLLGAHVQKNIFSHSDSYYCIEILSSPSPHPPPPPHVHSPTSFWYGLFNLWIWTQPLLQIWVQSKIDNNGKQCRSWWDGSLRAVSSGSILFAQILVLVCRYGLTALSTRFLSYQNSFPSCIWLQIQQGQWPTPSPPNGHCI